MEPIELHTWVSYNKDDERFKNIKWDELAKCVSFIDEFQRKFPIEDQIEEQPPKIIKDTFNPEGWIGTYRIGDQLLRVVPNPDRFSSKEFYEMRQELVSWLEYVGPAFESLYGQYANESLFEELHFAAYSRHLINYTEVLLSHFIPRNVFTKEYFGSELRGTPNWKKIMLQRAIGSPLLVSRKIEFSLRTLQNLLLTRFHAEMLAKIDRFLENIGMSGTNEVFYDWKKQLAYHREFVGTGIWSNLFEESLNIDFSSSEILDKTRWKTKGIAAEIVDLWEAYLAHKSFLSDFGNRFDTALKPLSKIYELWCFKKLSDLLEIDVKRIKKLPGRLTFKVKGAKQKLYYNTKRGLKKHSGFMKKVPVSIGRPDFLIESRGQIVCVMDAKCKTIKTLNIGDLQRILSYLMDFSYPTRTELTALILYISHSKKIRVITAGKGNLYLVPMTPSSFGHIKDDLRGIIESVCSI